MGNPSRLGTESRDQGSAGYLMVFTRNLETASAQYLLRHAAALGRRGSRLNLFLMDEALLSPGVRRVAMLPGAHVWVMADDEDRPLALADLDRTSWVGATELGELMRTPGIQTYWC